MGMVSEKPFAFSNPSPKLSNSFTARIFSDVAGDITIVVDGESLLLHKFPLVSRSGKIRKMVADAKDSAAKLELHNIPGGPHAFELAMKFCYGMNFEITSANVGHLRCAAEYLEMSEDYRDENLIERTETYINEVVIQSLEKSVEVLTTCQTLPPIAEEIGIPSRCVEAIATNACKEQLMAGLSMLNCDDKSAELKSTCLQWWIEDLSLLRIEYYQRVILAMARSGVRPDSIVASLMHFAQTSLKGIGKYQTWKKPDSLPENDQMTIVETLISLMPTEKSCPMPMSFMFGMLRMSIMLDAAISCRLEIERRIAYRLEMVTLDDILIPSLYVGGSLYDVDTIHRILVNFLQRIEEEDDDEECGYESEEGIGNSPSHSSLLKVGRLIDSFLAEIAPDPYLSLQKFIAMIEVLPDYARVIDDGIYRAVDIYLKVHSMLTDQECKKLCKLIDCQKLSQETCNHAAQNDRLPVQMTVKVLYFEQIRLKTALTGSSGDGFPSQRISSGVPSAAMSPRDNYASLRRENRELKQEISRMRVRLSELEKEQTFMKQGMMDKTRNSRTFLTSISKGIGKMGIFSGQTEGKRQKSSRKSSRKSRGIEGKTGRNRRHSLS